MSSLIACVSQTPKSTVNQDYCIEVENKIIPFKGIIVADGIGSHARSELSSKFCSDRLKLKLESIERKEDIDFNLLFSDIKNDLIEFIENELSDYELKNNPVGTTLICSIELEDEYKIAYVGNGSIWQLSGAFNSFSSNRYLPWNSINLLNPHTIEQEGRSALYKFFSIGESSSIPSIITLSKNQDIYSDIIIITTDGIFTNDQMKIGKDENDVIWIMGEETMRLLYEKLDIFFKDHPNSATSNDLKVMLNDYLTELKNSKKLDDDATLGIIIQSNVFVYQKKRIELLNSKRNEANTSK